MLDKANTKRLIRPTNHKPPTHERVRFARSRFYDLIAQFRVEAAECEDPSARALFEFAAEVIASLARAFRLFEDLQAKNLLTRQDSSDKYK
jgi:hypothetical protein